MRNNVTCTECDGEGTVDYAVGVPTSEEGFPPSATCWGCEGTSFEHEPDHDPDEPSEEELWVERGWATIEEMD